MTDDDIQRLRKLATAERERDEAAEQIAAWLDDKFGWHLSVAGTDRDDHNALIAQIRAGAWRTKGDASK